MIVCDLSPSAVEELVCVWNILLILCVCPAKICEYIVKLHHTLLVLNCVNILYNYIMLYWCCHTICVLNMTPHIPVTYISHLHGMPISNIVFTIHHNTLPPIDPGYKFPKDIFSGKPLTFWQTRPYCAKSEIWQGSRWWLWNFELIYWLLMDHQSSNKNFSEHQSPSKNFHGEQEAKIENRGNMRENMFPTVYLWRH